MLQNDCDSKEFYLFLKSSSKEELKEFYDKTTNKTYKLATAGWYMAMYGESIRVRQLKLFQE